MGLAATQARLLSLTSRLSNLELRAQKISNAKIRLSQEGEQASEDYQRALDKKVMKVENMSTQQFVNASLQNITSYTAPNNTEGTTSKFRYVTNSSGTMVITQSDADYFATHPQTNDENWYLGQMNVPVRKGSSAPDWDKTSQAYKYYDTVWHAVRDYYLSGGVNGKGVQIIPTDKAQDPEWISNQASKGGLYLYEFDPNTQDPKDPNGTGAFIGASWTSGDNTMQEVSDSTEVAKAEAKYEATMADINAKDKRFDAELKQIDTEHQATQTEIESLNKVKDKNIERAFKMFQA